MNIVRLALVGMLVGAIAMTYGFWQKAHPKVIVKAPTSRYHGYALNREAIKKAKLFTVLISWEGFKGTVRGTGVLIDTNHVLTCAHVASHNNDVCLVYFYPGYVLAHARPVFIDNRADLAILETDIPATPPSWPTFQEKHYDGEPITIIGNILGSMKWFVAYGVISGESGRDLYTDGLVAGGDSGGPWINEASEVLALSDWVLQEQREISGGVSAKTINKFLHSWKHPNVFQQMLQGGL